VTAPFINLAEGGLGEASTDGSISNDCGTATDVLLVVPAKTLVMHESAMARRKRMDFMSESLFFGGEGEWFLLVCSSHEFIP
jgi:hypothetical protein